MSPRDALGRSVDDALGAVHAAMLAGDVEALDLLLADDLVFTTPDGTVLTKGADLDAHRTGTTAFSQVQEHERNVVEGAGGGTAQSVSVVDVELTDHGVPIAGTARYTRGWVARDGRWQVRTGSAAPTDA